MGFRSICFCVLTATTALVTEAAMVPLPQSGQTGTVDLTYVDSSFAAGALVRPRQAMDSKFGKTAVQSAFEGTEFEDLMKEFSANFGIELQDVKQLAVLVREENLAASVGIKLPEEGQGAKDVLSQVELKNQLRQIALAFHNYVDVNRAFPSATGNLSWRVHLLPYLEQQDLYEQFDLDEPWDSDTNKPLIARMPDIFKVLSVKAEGKTSLHVFVGDGAPFEKELRFRDIIDGTSNTIMAAMAGAETATEWTKPGGLKINDKDPLSAFGDTDGDPVLVAMLDGSVTQISADIEPETLTALLTYAGREVVTRPGDMGRSGPNPETNPTLIVHSVKPIQKDKAIATLGQGLGKPEQKKGNGHQYWDVGGYAIWFPNDSTMVATQSKLLPRLMANRSEASKLRNLFASHGKSDIVLVGDTETMPTVFGQFAKDAPLPAFREITDVCVTVDVSSAGLPLIHAELGMSSENTASGMQAMAGGALAMGQQLMAPENIPPGMEGLTETLSGLMKGVKVEREGSKLTYTIRKPADYDRQVDGLKPEFQKLAKAVRSARQAAARMGRSNVMRQIGLAFHNHHDVYNTFGAANGKTRANGGRKAGLSWRVHLLPFMEENELYSRFELDEPWDSDHNKKLIAEMPDCYKVEGAEKGKTSIHVLVGDGGAFGDGKTAIKLRDVTDGSSNTILAVQAGADKAEFWTKPGGLKLDEENPISTFGEIGDTFIALLFDGSVRNISKSIDGDILKDLSSPAGGERVDGF